MPVQTGWPGHQSASTSSVVRRMPLASTKVTLVGLPSVPSTRVATSVPPTLAKRRSEKRTGGPDIWSVICAAAGVAQVVDGDGDGRQDVELLALRDAAA